MAMKAIEAAAWTDQPGEHDSVARSGGDMTKKLGILVIHGMGNPEEHFADGLVRRLKKRLGVAEADIAFSSCFWSPILQDHQDVVWERLLLSNAMDAKAIRKWVVSALGDPALYLSGFFKNGQPIYSNIHQCVRNSLAELEAELRDSDAKPLMILAHSLGSVIISNYIWDEQTGQGIGRTAFERTQTLTSFITYGSTIPLFIPPVQNIKCIKFPDPNLDATYKNVAQWINIFDPDDVLGYPLNDVWTDRQGTMIKDTTINAGLWPASETPLAHTFYHQDDDFLSIVIEQIQTILAT
jgi:hypothetical protein